MRHTRRRHTKTLSHQRRRHKPKSHRTQIFGLGLSVFLAILLVFYLIPSVRAVMIIGGLTLVGILLSVAGVMHPRRKKASRITHPSHYIPDALRRSVLARDQYQCCECGSHANLEMDHIIPLSKGGATSVENLQVLCHSCNLKKGNR